MAIAKLHYEIRELVHKVHRATGYNAARVRGVVSSEQRAYAFSMWLKCPDRGHWEILDPPMWDGSPPATLRMPSFWQQLEQKADGLLRTVNMWPDEQNPEGGARLSLNEIRTPDDAIAKVFASFRPEMLNVPSPPWEDLWVRISDRVLHDPFFYVQGLRPNEVVTAVETIQKVFPASWVKSRYIQRGCESMGGTYPKDDGYWFPTYHLCRTACGAICVDPGWNYLVDLGLSLNELGDFPKLDSVQRKLAQHPGLIHQVVLASFFKRKGMLVELEPDTGLGNHKNDLTLSVGGRLVDLEIKVLTSGKPGARLEVEIRDKTSQLPSVPRRPTFIYALLAEKGWYSKEKEEAFYADVQKLSMGLPANLSGVLLGKMWLDSAGGRTKHYLHSVLPYLTPGNSGSADIWRSFLSTQSVAKTYPQFGIPAFFAFSAGSKEQSESPIEQDVSGES